MDVNGAIRLVQQKFPFEGYMSPEDDGSKNSYTNIAETVLRHLPLGSRILDFGCGPCDKAAILQLLGYRCAGYDELKDDWHTRPGNEEKILRFAEEMGIDFVKATSEGLRFPAESFDMVMSHDVLEHLHDSPKDLLNTLLSMVKPGGFLFITVPNAANIRKRLALLWGHTNLPSFESYYWYPGPWRGHVREYVRSDLALLAKYLGLDVLELHGCDHMLHRVPKSLRLPYRVATSVFGDWKDSWALVARKSVGWAPREGLDDVAVKEILARGTSYRYER